MPPAGSPTPRLHALSRGPQSAPYQSIASPGRSAARAPCRASPAGHQRPTAARLRTAAQLQTAAQLRPPLATLQQCRSRSCAIARRARRRGVCAAAAAAVAAVPAAAGGSPLLAASLAKLVGWLVVTGSCVRSLPQIVRVTRNRSVAGLSLTSFSSELLCYLVSVAYNLYHGYAFSTYGDTAICAVQNAAIVGLIFQLGSVPQRVQVALAAGLAGAGWWLLSGSCPPATLTALQAGSVVLLAVGGRLPQILLNVRRGGSGELSLLSCGLSLVGNLARVFTTAVLVRDPIILGSAGTQAILNGILTWQCLATARAAARAAPAAQAA